MVKKSGVRKVFSDMNVSFPVLEDVLSGAEKYVDKQMGMNQPRKKRRK